MRKNQKKMTKIGAQLLDVEALVVKWGSENNFFAREIFAISAQITTFVL